MLSDVQGQPEAVLFLRSLVSGKFNDPLLLVGDEGTGRRFSVVQAVKEVFCQEDRDAACRCGSCTQIDRGVHPDLLTVAAGDDKLIKVDTVREVIALAWERPSIASHRFIMIDGADRMTPEAGNAFLKVLEEPPPLTRFVLLAESYAHVLGTIRSRCGKVAYRALPESFVLSVLRRVEPDDGKASIYARMGEGSVGRSVTYCMAGRLGLRDRSFKLIQLALDGDLPSLFSTVDSIGPDLPLALRFVEHLLHDLLMISIAPDRVINLDLKEEVQRARGRAKLEVWERLGAGVRAVLARHRRTRIALPFHVKALFADTILAA